MNNVLAEWPGIDQGDSASRGHHRQDSVVLATQVGWTGTRVFWPWPAHRAWLVWTTRPATQPVDQSIIRCVACIEDVFLAQHVFHVPRRAPVMPRLAATRDGVLDT